MKNKQQGFSLVELVIVVIILGLLAVTALPRLISVTEDAEDATVEGVAGGFATGVGIARTQWELDGRPSGNGANANTSTIVLDQVTVGVDGNIGYPTNDGSDNSLSSTMSATDCQEVFDLILQSSPRSTTTFNTATILEVDYYINVSSNVCYYYLTQTIKDESSAPTNTTTGNGFTYDASLGQVEVFSNN
ncbi:prepilin-type N-terminal cleavage/methylation domain-containing protein [Catenovulum sp. SM1970]|uniref:prepilin-type N-terminal cleavage/methylation domain-containing protein n=1 Tax=Marinifaba aquimaris TaxID=2741323 RepID=UPI0015726B27|nr:prepilin-type N-terminal cleavage/methylation domain-containing protein [Marinifaba aquimaris]NTS75865.1 prepilin-type N-terminal cleavage/methylation domain-containing protein [Marinifaba aquimaris]